VILPVDHGTSFADGRQEERPLAELAEYVTEVRNPGNRRGVQLARVELDEELLRAGLELVNTPGIGSIHSHNTEVARGFLELARIERPCAELAAALERAAECRHRGGR
jgi:hypothetical protein